MGCVLGSSNVRRIGCHEEVFGCYVYTYILKDGVAKTIAPALTTLKTAYIFKLNFP